MIPPSVEVAGQKLLTQNQVLGTHTRAGQSPQTTSSRVYINWYINGYGRPWTSVDPNLTMRPDHGQIADSCGVLLVTTEQMAFVAIPGAEPPPHTRFYCLFGAVSPAAMWLSCSDEMSHESQMQDR
jgi:hypothetical protein